MGIPKPSWAGLATLLLLISTAQAVEYVAHVNIRPNPYQRAVRMSDTLNPNDKEKIHVPRVKVIETSDRVMFDVQVPGHPMSADDHIRGLMIYLNQTVISKIMFTPDNVRPRAYFEIDKKYLAKGDEITIVSDCYVEDVYALDLKYHEDVTPNVYLLK